MDLIVSDGFIGERSTQGIRVDPRSQRSIDLAYNGVQSLPYVLSPGERILLSTKEVLEVPLGCVGYICLRSTFARLGLLSPPTVADPGFKGTLTMEVYNASRNPLLIESGVALWSIHFLALVDASFHYNGRYQGQTQVTAPKALKE